MLQSMNPVDREIGEEEEHRRARHQVQPPMFPKLIHPVIHLRVTPYLRDKPGKHQQIYPRCSYHARFDLLPDLVLDVPGMMFESTVEEEVVGEGADHVVEDKSTDECDGVE